MKVKNIWKGPLSLNVPGQPLVQIMPGESYEFKDLKLYAKYYQKQVVSLIASGKLEGEGEKKVVSKDEADKKAAEAQKAAAEKLEAEKKEKEEKAKAEKAAKKKAEKEKAAAEAEKEDDGKMFD